MVWSLGSKALVLTSKVQGLGQFRVLPSVTAKAPDHTRNLKTDNLTTNYKGNYDYSGPVDVYTVGRWSLLSTSL